MTEAQHAREFDLADLAGNVAAAGFKAETMPLDAGIGAMVVPIEALVAIRPAIAGRFGSPGLAGGRALLAVVPAGDVKGDEAVDVVARAADRAGATIAMIALPGRDPAGGSAMPGFERVDDIELGDPLRRFRVFRRDPPKRLDRPGPRPGEPAGNLRARAAWFGRRSGGAD